MDASLPLLYTILTDEWEIAKEGSMGWSGYTLQPIEKP
jgi:hypothetical protein